MMNDIFSGERLYRDVITYVNIGEHRTGTAGDNETAEWIFSQLSEAGLETFYNPFVFRQFYPTSIRLIVRDKPLQAFPEWTPHFSGPEPITAQLVRFISHGPQLRNKIVLVKNPTSRTEAAGFRERLRVDLMKMAEEGVLAVVLITPGPSGEVFVAGDDEGSQPFALPLLGVGARDEALLDSIADTGEQITFQLDGTQIDRAESRVVLARRGGNKGVIIISTPTTGWFTCGGERGPGVALSLALARWVGRRKPGASYLFDFNSGHELMGIGAKRFLAEKAPRPSDVKSWLHLGANIGTFDWERGAPVYKPKPNPAKYVVQCASQDILPVVQRAFAGIPEVKPVVGPGIGELTAFIKEGYRAWGVFGGRHYYFHNPSDGPQTTSPALLAPIAAALVKSLEIFESE